MGQIIDLDPLIIETEIPPTKGASYFKKITLYLRRLWVETCAELRYDLRFTKPTRWRRSPANYFTWFLFAIWALGLVALCPLLPLYITRGRSWSNSSLWNYCAPDGSFSLEPTDPWKPEWVFQITLAFGSMSFTQAKAVDIAWDIGIGRLGQTMLAYYSWKAFSVHVRVSIENMPITYWTFWTSFMQSEGSLRSWVRLTRDFTLKRRLQSKTAMIFMLAAMVFIMVFPTLASAMTGYTANNVAVVKLDESTQTRFGGYFKQVEYIIHDGDRVNLSANFPVFNDGTWNDALFYVDNYISKYGITKNIPSNWTKINEKGDKQSGAGPDELQSPTLNITVYDGVVNNESFIYTPNNAMYTLPYITQNALCQPAASSLQQTYQWGFSVPQLEVTLILLTIWTFGTWIMWLDAHLKLKSRGQYEVPRGLKAVLYLADSIRHDFNDLGEEPELLTDEELQRLARENLRDGKVKIQAPEFQTDHSLWRSSWHWLKDNYIWAAAYIAALATCYDWNASLLMSCVMSFAMAAGWGRKTRAVISWAVFIVGVPISIFYVPNLAMLM